MASRDLTTEAGIIDYLQDGTYAEGKKAIKATRLEEGFGGFVYRVELDDWTSIIVKHAEGYAARAQEWKLDTKRMMYEYEAMNYLSQPSMQSDSFIRTPKLLNYDNQSHVLIMEDAGNLHSLKGWFQPGADRSTAIKIGDALGRYLAHIHNSTAGREDVLSHFNGNSTAKYLSGTLYFGGLPTSAEKLGYNDDFFKDVAIEAQKEVEESNDVLTLGDFWTGNVLVSPNNQYLNLFVLDLELSKPGTAEFDIGQMAAEMYCLAAFRDYGTGTELLKAFLMSYKENRNVEVDAGKVAIRIGAHLIVMMPGVWSREASQEKVDEVVKIGADLIKAAWRQDRATLRGSIVGSLL